MNTPIQAVSQNAVVELHNFFCVTHDKVIFDQMMPSLVLVVNGDQKERAFICSECRAQLPRLAILTVHSPPPIDADEPQAD
jgi:hypothetical protein